MIPDHQSGKSYCLIAKDPRHRSLVAVCDLEVLVRDAFECGRGRVRGRKHARAIGHLSFERAVKALEALTDHPGVGTSGVDRYLERLCADSDICHQSRLAGDVFNWGKAVYPIDVASVAEGL